MKKIAFPLLALSTLFIQGCASLGMGESEFSCPGKPNGVNCKSTREMYELTHNGNVPSQMGDGTVSQHQQSSEVTDETKIHVITDNYIAPSMPVGSVPIRTPAKVMRILIAPFEDTDKDLHVSSYIYTEVESRKWLYDTDYSVSNTNIRPLQSIPVEKPKKKKQ